jgi:hypothetical protein
MNVINGVRHVVINTGQEPSSCTVEQRCGAAQCAQHAMDSGSLNTVAKSTMLDLVEMGGNCRYPSTAGKILGSKAPEYFIIGLY